MNWQDFIDNPWIILTIPILWISKEVYSFKGRYATKKEVHDYFKIIREDLSYLRKRFDEQYDKKSPEE